MATKKKFYAVKKGYQTGIFTTWAECQKQTQGFKGALFTGPSGSSGYSASSSCSPSSATSMKGVLECDHPLLPVMKRGEF